MDICCERRRYGSHEATHAHPFEQLILPLCGSLRLRSGAVDETVGEHQLFAVPAGAAHTYFAQVPNECVVLDLPDGSLFVRQRPASARVALLDERWKALRTLFLYETDPAALHSLARYASSLLGSASNFPSLDYLHSHFNQPVTLAELARLEHFSPSYYCTWFKEQTGTTPAAYLQRLRIERAKEYLSDGLLCIADIAQSVGFCQQSSLTRLFLRQEGMTPAQYRILQRTAKNSGGSVKRIPHLFDTMANEIDSPKDGFDT